MPILKKISDFIASYKLSCLFFLLLLLLTYLGTLHQVEHGLHQSQKKYFESLYVIHWFYGVAPVPLPGGYLLLMLTFVNIFWGAAVRFRLKWSQAGFILMHLGILILLAGTFVSYVFSISANLILFEGGASNEIENIHEWELGISEAGVPHAVKEYIIPQRDFMHLSGRRSRQFVLADLPFTLELREYYANASVSDSGGGELMPMPMDSEYQRNRAGLRVCLTDGRNGEKKEGAVWAGNLDPTVISSSGKLWNISLRKQRIPLPYTLRLDRFIHRTHPGTHTPREFISEVTKIEGDVSRQFKITMNEPFRHLGYTFYQSSWGEQDGKIYSVFSVVNNPADPVPLYACLITTVGLILHFLRKLAVYLSREKGRRS